MAEDDKVSEEVFAAAKRLAAGELATLLRLYNTEVGCQAMELLLAYVSGNDPETLDAICENIREYATTIQREKLHS
jgi:hypothetical protein